MKFTSSLSLTLLAIIFAGISCSPEENNPLDTGQNPIISKINIQQKWNNLNADPYKIEVWVQDPQGIRNLKTVKITIVQDLNQEIVLEDSLLDDGGYLYPDDGDVLAGDGVFSNHFRADQISLQSEELTFTLNVIAMDEDFNQNQLFSYPLVIGENQSPKIHRIEAPDSLSADKPGITFSISVSDSNGIGDVLEAYFESEDLTKGYTKFEQFLYNDGDMEIHGDEIPGDSIFSTKITPEFGEGKVGHYNLRFYVRDSYGEMNKEIASHVIYIGNLPPEIVSISMPDTLHIPAGTGVDDYNYKPITVQVSDPEGLGSIDSVYFYSRKPDGELANNGSPFVMVDNGQAFNINDWFRFDNYGDQTANDGYYAYPLIVRNDFDPGVYTFIFYVRDKAGNLVGPINKDIELISPLGQIE